MDLVGCFTRRRSLLDFRSSSISSSAWLFLLTAYLLTGCSSLTNAQLCTVRNGATHLTADVQTQPNSDSSTVTVFLNNIIGSPDEIDLSVMKDGPFSDWFMVNGKQLLLTRSLTEQHQLPEHITLRLKCTRRRLIPTIPTYITVHVRIVQLLQQIIMPRVVTISELTPVGTTIYQANPREFGRTGYTYSIVNEDVKEYFVVTDPLQGWIAVRRPLDFERQQEYHVKIRATDGVNTDEFVVTVRIQDSNDLDPAFEYAGCQRISNVCINPRYTATCYLRQAGGTLKVLPEPIRAYDRDTLRYPIRYSLLPESQPASFASYFRINPESGEIRQIRPMDQLDVKEYTIYVKAEEVAPPGGLARSSVAQLQVNVRTQNSHRPIIRAPSTICYIPENAPVGFRATISANSQTPYQLNAYDADVTGGPGRFTYSIGGVYGNYFQVTPEGYIQCIRPGFASQVTNRENIKISVTCTEQDTTEVLTSDPLDITVVIAKVNEHTPRLQQYNPVELRAGPPDGRPVVTVNAIDEDQGKDGQLTYAIVYVQRLAVSTNNPTPADARGIFVINVDTGVILQRGTVYKGELYEIKVRATDGGGKFDEGIIRVKVVDDGRNEAPVFVNPSYVASIPEGVPLHYPVIVVTARDPDNQPLLYSIIGGNEEARFAIDANTGSIHTIAAIDYEERRSYTLVIQARDPSNAMATTTVSILINDINDNDPEFVSPRPPIVFSVPENQAPLRVGIVSATDKDTGPNGDITYSIPPNPLFRINEKTGEITVVVPLDFERQQQHTLIVTARDNGFSYSSDRGIVIPSPRSATAVVTINVIDTEDEDPTFIDRIYYAEVYENRPAGLEVVQVSATDPDTRKQISYVILKGDTNAFAIDPQSGIITTRIPLDYETTNRYQLIVGTNQNQKSSPSSSATVYINVLNENDVGPRFVGGPYVASIGRQAPLNTVIQTILARDGDTTSRITYAIEGDAKAQQFFQVDPNTGEIRVSGDLTRDTDVVYNLIVTARDSGNPPQTATSTVIVNVIDAGQPLAPLIEAESPPVQFALPQYQVKIREGSNLNTLVEELRIINKPPSGIQNLRCEIVSGNTDNAFATGPTSSQDCEVKTAGGPIDFETRNEHEIVVQATGATANEPNFRIDTRVVVSVVNMNDNAPQFIFAYPGLTGGRYFGAIDVNSNVGTPVLKVSATDADKGEFGIIRYTMIPSVPAQRFEINDESGLVSTRVTFIDSTPDNEPYEFTVQARDSPNQPTFKAAAATVIINLIRDQNRFILVLEGTDAAKTRDAYANAIVKIIQQNTGKIIGVEKITHRDILDGNRTRPDFASTDMWMYAIDPDTRRIMTFLDLQSILLSREIQDRRLSEIQTILVGTDRAVEFRAPYILPGLVQPLVYKTWSVWGFEAGLIALAALIILFGIIAIIVLCYLWARYQEHLKRQRYIQPRMEPVMFEPVPPEYETQILQMNVNEDDNADLGEVNVGFTPRAGIDSVTYIKNQEERQRQANMAASRSESRYTNQREATYQSTNPIYDNPDGAINASASYSHSNNTTAARRMASSATHQREGIANLALASEEDDEERLMARSTLTSDQSRVVSSTRLRDDYEAPRSYSYSYAYSREFAQNGLKNTRETASTASHL